MRLLAICKYAHRKSVVELVVERRSSRPVVLVGFSQIFSLSWPETTVHPALGARGREALLALQLLRHGFLSADQRGQRRL